LSGLHPEQRKHAAQKYPAFDAYEERPDEAEPASGPRL